MSEHNPTNNQDNSTISTSPDYVKKTDFDAIQKELQELKELISQTAKAPQPKVEEQRSAVLDSIYKQQADEQVRKATEAKVAKDMEELNSLGKYAEEFANLPTIRGISYANSRLKPIYDSYINIPNMTPEEKKQNIMKDFLDDLLTSPDNSKYKDFYPATHKDFDAKYKTMPTSERMKVAANSANFLQLMYQLMDSTFKPIRQLQATGEQKVEQNKSVIDLIQEDYNRRIANGS